MSKDKGLLLIGGGGHCKSILDTLYRLDSYDKIGIIEQISMKEGKILDTRIVGVDEDLERLFAEGYTDAFVAVGSVGNTTVREKIYNRISDIGFMIPNIVDSLSYIGTQCRLSRGIFIGKNVIVNANVSIGGCAIINTSCTIEHDCTIGAFAHIAPSATICGNVCIEEYSHIGANATVIQGIHIGRNVIVGAGSVVTKSIESNQKYFGIPAKKR